MLASHKILRAGVRVRTRARAVTGTTKYGGQYGRMNLAAMGLPSEVSQDLEVVGNHGLARKTWSSYATAVKMFNACCREKGISSVWPIRDKTILIFIHWLLKARRVGASTIELYLAGLRAEHIAQGWPAPAVRSELVNTIILLSFIICL